MAREGEQQKPDLSGFYFWVNNPNVDLFKEDKPGGPVQVNRTPEELSQQQSPVSLDGQLTDFASVIFEHTATTIYHREEEITDPRVKKIAQDFSNELLPEFARHLSMFQRAMESNSQVIQPAASDAEKIQTKPRWWTIGRRSPKDKT